MIDERLTLALKAAKLSGEKILSYFDPKGSRLSVKHKTPSQPVTLADLEANRIIKEELAPVLKTDGWLSEEDEDSGDRFNKEFVWIVDPLDGTRDFIIGNPEFTVSIGLVQNSKPVLGVIYNPVTQELFWAQKSKGAFLNGEPICVKRPVKGLLEILVSRAEFARGEWPKEKWPFIIKPTGGSAYKLALIAKGEAHAALTFIQKSEWDVCAGAIIIEEAQGQITTAFGEPLIFNKAQPLVPSLLYAHPQHHEALLQFILSKNIKQG